MARFRRSTRPPARADCLPCARGSSANPVAGAAVGRVHRRARGTDAAIRPSWRAGPGSSPRARGGSLSRPCAPRRCSGFIPARAGLIPAPRATSGSTQVHPRVGGGRGRLAGQRLDRVAQPLRHRRQRLPQPAPARVGFCSRALAESRSIGPRLGTVCHGRESWRRAVTSAFQIMPLTRLLPGGKP